MDARQHRIADQLISSLYSEKLITATD